MMKIRKFVASSVPLALQQVRDALGDRAVILNTRSIPGSRDPEARVEVTAALDEERAPQPAAVAVGVAAAPDPPRDLLGRVYGRSTPGAAGAPVRVGAGREGRPRWRPDAPGAERIAGERPIRSAADWLASLPAVARTEPAATATAAAPPPSRPAPTGGGEADSRLVSQLRQLEEVVHRMARQTSGFELPLEVARLGERLRRTGLEEVHVCACLQQLMRSLDSAGMDDREAVARAAGEILLDLLPGSKDLRIGRAQKVVALVGPSGSGKTTAAAQIAAGFARRRPPPSGDPGEIVWVVTDTRRVGALEQARSFCILIGVALETAYDEGEMALAVARHPHARLVLIDTQGVGPHERDEIERQQGLFAAAGVGEVHLVVDGLTGFEHVVEVAKAWKGAAGLRLLFAKMDQAVRPGAVVSAAAEAAVPTSYLTLSAAVPGGIRPGDLQPYVEWMVGLGPRPFTRDAAA